MILIDRRKAFDAINHEIFLQRLKTIRYSKGVDTIFLSEYFLLVLKVSPQVLEKSLVEYHKALSFVFDLCQQYGTSSQINFTFICR